MAKKFNARALGAQTKFGSLNLYFVKKLGPELAQLMLDTSPGNRKDSRRGLVYLEDILIKKNWQETAEPIRFDKRGHLRDGHHRLKAVITAGIPISVIVAMGLTEAAIRSLDTGVMRTIQNMLQIEGFKNSGILGPMLTQLLCWQAGDRMANSPAKILPEDAVAVARRFDDETQYSLTFGKAGKALFPHSVTSFLHFHCTQITSKQVADDFFTKLCLGTDLNRGHPALALRNRMLSIKNSNDKSTVQPYIKKHMMINGWNSWRAGKEVIRIQTPSIISNHTFPTPSQ